MLVHLCVDENEIRIQFTYRPGKAVERYRAPGLLTAVREVHEPWEYAGAAVGRQELLVPAGLEWKKVEAVMLSELLVAGKTGEGQSVTVGGQAPGKLDARVDDAGKAARYNEEASHS